MLGKLMKHEFRATGRVGLPLCGVMVALAVIAGFTMRFIVTEWSAFLYGFTGALPMILFLLSIFAVAVGVFIILMQSFKRNLLGDEGYLMRVLPVSMHELLLSKLLVALIWYIAAAVLIVVSVLVMLALSGELGQSEFSDILRHMREFFSMLDARIWVHSILGWLGAMALITLIFYADFTLSQTFSKHKVLYNVMGVVIFIVLLRLIFGLNDTLDAHFFQTMKMTNDSIGIIGGADGPTTIYVTKSSYVGLIELYVFDLLLYFLTWGVLKYRPNLE